MMGSSSMIKIFLATSAVASPKLVVLSVLIYLGSSQTLHRHRFPKWALSGIDEDEPLGKMAERMSVSFCANGGFTGTIKTKISGRPSLFRSSGLRRLDMNSSCFQLTGFRIFLPPRFGRHIIESSVQLRAGTSGYAYKEWKGSFYPEKLPDREMLRFYSQHFSTVEINHSFYRMPTERLLVQWAECVPGGFQFALKANQQITHIQKLRNCESTLKRFLEAASILGDGDHLGPILVQLPPTFRADIDGLEEFLKLRPRAFRFALEVRHSSWHSDETYALLRQYQTALRSEEHTSELQSLAYLVCRLLLEKRKKRGCARVPRL